MNISVVDTKSIRSCNNYLKQVACHIETENNCSITVCHMIDNTKVFQVKISYTKQKKHQTNYLLLLAVCHYDTKLWPAVHQSFKILAKQPGVPICHFILYDNYVICPGQ
ncbi:unnamed protein product [Didymodactylos carnosus]|uniref:BURP domain-containing protein n=1 Tax=Didymodactylos carnosus TaxID=1234261 RepID=A0A8S2FEV4_9BILA|nr:unnamed protein product [Didymodactylos carnosus]CAF4242219.1 unnamed protein product [Didymodactylos carnosus]